MYYAQENIVNCVLYTGKIVLKFMVLYLGSGQVADLIFLN